MPNGRVIGPTVIRNNLHRICLNLGFRCVGAAFVELLVSLIVGLVMGFGVRAMISRRRNDRVWKTYRSSHLRSQAEGEDQGLISVALTF
jgi:hypothetical protein